MSRTAPELPPGLLARRRERILEALGDGAMVLPAADIAYRSRDTEYPYRPDSELFYVTGLTGPGAVAVLLGKPTEDGERFILFVRPRDEQAELWHGPRLDPREVGEGVGADRTVPLGDLEDQLPGLLAGSGLVHFRLASGGRCDALVRRALATARMRGARDGSGPRGVLDPGGILDELRLRKDAEEVARLREAAHVTTEAHRRALARAGPGTGEWEVEGWIDGTFRTLGADGPAYGSIVGSGPNACVLHYVANARVMEEGELVLLDAGASVGLYAADVTRTFPVSGRYTAEQRAVYEVVEAARRAAVGAVAPGARTSDVHGAAVSVLVAGLLELGALDGSLEELIGSEAHKPFFPHKTSHWLGIDVHDPGDYARDGEARILEPGMVLTVEPGLYFQPGVGEERAGRFEGIGVRIEDDVLVTGEGREVLTAGLPTDPDEVAGLVGLT